MGECVANRKAMMKNKQIDNSFIFKVSVKEKVNSLIKKSLKLQEEIEKQIFAIKEKINGKRE